MEIGNCLPISIHLFLLNRSQFYLETLSLEIKVYVSQPFAASGGHVPKFWMRYKWKCYMRLWEVLIVIPLVYGWPASLASILSLILNSQATPNGLDSNCELHHNWLKCYPSPLPASYLPPPTPRMMLLCSSSSP